VAVSLAAFLIPLIACWLMGTSPAVARILIGAGIVLYISSSVLRTFFIRKGAGVPGWVPFLGLAGTGLAPAGIAILLLLSVGLIARV
jgi:hypothetical protein